MRQFIVFEQYLSALVDRVVPLQSRDTLGAPHSTSV
jgi:hypothetical protein